MRCKVFLFLMFVAAAVTPSPAVQISLWTFETNTPPDLSNSTTSPNAAADVGNGTASGLHVSTGTDWTTPVGNGSGNSFNANQWAIGDYWQFRLSTAGFEDITLRWDQTRSATGPGTFDFAYSLDGTTFTTALNNYIVPAITWSSVSPDGTMTTTFPLDLSGISALDNASSVTFRLIADAAASNVDGSNRVDNFTVNAVARATVPESLPFGFVVATFAGLLGWGVSRGRRETQKIEDRR